MITGKNKIKIANELELPIDAITQTFAQIGKRGAGKTYLASMIAEQMLNVQAQVIVLDPIGNWWGLRVDADGKSKGKDIFIIGGTHGDVPLASEGGKEIAKLLVEKSISVVLDISEFRKNERKKFVTDFAEEFYQLKKKKPSAVHIFLEESQKFVPQVVRGDDARMVGAWEDIVRLGRNYGIGCSLISQRPQSVNKEVLSQVECLCVPQVVGRHERKALEEWIREAGEDRSIVDKLPSLHQGEGYVWSPSWLRIFKKVNFNKKSTFDTSATPKLGEATKSAKISKMDIEKLREQMVNVVGKINQEKLDRKSLIDEISRLKKELKSKPKAELNLDVIEGLKKRAHNEGFNEAKKEIMREVDFLRKENKCLIGIMDKVGNLLKVKPALRPEYSFKPKTILTKEPSKVDYTKEITPKVTNKSPISYESDTNRNLGICARKLYSVLFVNQDTEFTKVQLGLLSGYSTKSGGFRNSLAQLNSMGLIQRNNGKISINEINEEYAIENTEGISKELWSKNLGVCARKIFEFLLGYENTQFTKEDIAENVVYSVNSGGFKNSLAQLNSLGLIKRDNGLIKLNPEILELT